MKFMLIEEPPKDAKEYTEASHHDREDRFVENLRELLKSHPLPIVAKDIPIAWATKVEDFAIQNGFEILMLRSVVNPTSPEIGTAFGTFYYKKKKSN